MFFSCTCNSIRIKPIYSCCRTDQKKRWIAQFQIRVSRFRILPTWSVYLVSVRDIREMMATPLNQTPLLTQKQKEVFSTTNQPLYWIEFPQCNDLVSNYCIERQLKKFKVFEMFFEDLSLRKHYQLQLHLAKVIFAYILKSYRGMK